jgi:hypothetical protein
MAQLHHHEDPSLRFLQEYGSSDEKQYHDHEQEHNSSTGFGFYFREVHNHTPRSTTPVEQVTDLWL